MAFIGCSHAFLCVWTEGTFLLLRRHWTSSWSFFYTGCVTWEPTCFLKGIKRHHTNRYIIPGSAETQPHWRQETLLSTQLKACSEALEGYAKCLIPRFKSCFVSCTRLRLWLRWLQPWQCWGQESCPAQCGVLEWALDRTGWGNPRAQSLFPRCFPHSLSEGTVIHCLIFPEAHCSLKIIFTAIN